jgi:hypothetical protein
MEKLTRVRCHFADDLRLKGQAEVLLASNVHPRPSLCLHLAERLMIEVPGRYDRQPDAGADDELDDKVTSVYTALLGI